jgi:hypothetical protein
MRSRSHGQDALVVAGERDRDVSELLHLALNRGHAFPPFFCSDD